MRYLYCLPWAPSLNNAYANRLARVKRGPKAGKPYMARMLSKEGEAYRAAVRVAVRAGHAAPPRLQGRLAITVLACPPDRIRRDLDNHQKVLFDALTLAGVVGDDSQYDAIAIFRGAPVAGGKMLVSISPFDPDAAGHALNAVGLPTVHVGASDSQLALSRAIYPEVASQ